MPSSRATISSMSRVGVIGIIKNHSDPPLTVNILALFFFKQCLLRSSWHIIENSSTIANMIVWVYGNCHIFLKIAFYNFEKKRFLASVSILMTFKTPFTKTNLQQLLQLIICYLFRITYFLLFQYIIFLTIEFLAYTIV